MDRKRLLWKHAYCLKYRNRRAGAIVAFHQVSDWDEVLARLREARKG